MEKTIKITYYGREDGHCKTIFREVENPRRYYNRVDGLGWYTCYPSQGYYECSSSVSDDVVFEIVDDNGKVLFSESNVKLGAFCSIPSKSKQVATAWAEQLNLKGYTEWRDMLSAEYEKSQKSEYLENWLYCCQDTVKREILETYEHLGITFVVIHEVYQHKECKKMWEEIFIENKECELCEAMAGFIF